jgi:hypothetical protein
LPTGAGLPNHQELCCACIEENPAADRAGPCVPLVGALSQLVLALEGQQGFEIKELYELDFDSFDLALQLLVEWRLDRHFSAKFRLMDISLAAQDLKAQAGT